MLEIKRGGQSEPFKNQEEIMVYNGGGLLTNFSCTFS